MESSKINPNAARMVRFKDAWGRVAHVWDPREHKVLALDPDTGHTVGSHYDAWTEDDARERIRLISVGMPNHIHHWIPKDGAMTCQDILCGARYVNGKVQP